MPVVAISCGFKSHLLHYMRKTGWGFPLLCYNEVMRMNVLELKNVYFRQGNFVLKNINFKLKDGELVVLKGKSGSGKSALIELIGNAKQIDAGKILYFNKEMYEDESGIRRRLSVVYDDINFNEEMTGKKIIREIHKYEPFFSVEDCLKRFKDFGINSDMKVRMLSADMKKKLLVIIAISRNPDILVMDEPTKGLDEESRNEIWNMIFDYKINHDLSILFSSHHEHEMELLADRVVWMENGGIR